jgi:hypothetical protein
MLTLPDPRRNPLLRESSPLKLSPAQIADRLVRLERLAARRERAFGRHRGVLPNEPARWFRPEPRPSVQYAGHMSTTAARDHRLTPQSKALLQVLRARCGTGTRTETCKTTLAHIMGVTTRSIGRYVSELVRFGYIDTRVRRGVTGLYTGLVVSITEKVLPCFRKATWLAGWLAHNLAAETGGKPDGTRLSYKNHSFKEHPNISAPPPDR